MTASYQESFQRAVSSFEEGRFEDAERLLSEINAEHPDHLDVMHLSALVALKSGHNAEAIERVQRALARAPEEPRFLGLLGTLLKQQGDVEGAVAAFHRAIDREPGNAEFLYNLANLHRKSNEVDKAIDYYERAISVEPNFAHAYYNLGKMLKDVGRLTEAEAACRKASELQPDNPQPHINLGNVLRELDRREEAIEEFQAALRIAPDYQIAQTNLCHTLLELGRGSECLVVADHLLAIKPGNTYGLALKSCALQVLGDRETLERLINIPRLVHAKRVDPPPIFNSLADFNAALGNHLASHPDLTYEPAGKSTYAGSQVSNLKTEPIGPIGLLEKILQEAYLEYREALDVDLEHPFDAAAPDDYELNIFGTILTKTGHQIPHFHAGGWLSGVYYVEVPEEVKAGGPDRTGWIELARPPPNIKLDREPYVESRQPEEGLMFLFPSFLYHNTVPLAEPARRISISFDFKPSG